MYLQSPCEFHQLLKRTMKFKYTSYCTQILLRFSVDETKIRDRNFFEKCLQDTITG